MTHEYLIRLPSGEVRETGRPQPDDTGSDVPLYVVSNDISANSEIYAPEIDFYLRYRDGSSPEYIENLGKDRDALND